MAMTLDEYQRLALRTKAPHNTLECAALGLAGESGEFADLIKKHVYHSHPLDRLKAAKEIGDVLWYCALAADVLGITLDDVAQMNVDKLAKRYPEGFSVERSKTHGGT